MTAIDQTQVSTKADREAEHDRRQGERYLEATDWMVIRKLETGKDIPAQVATLRANARVKADKV